MPVKFKGIETGRDDVIRFPPDQLDQIVGLNLRAPITDESVETLAQSIADAGDLEEGALRALIRAVSDDEVQRLYERFRVDSEAA